MSPYWLGVLTLPALAGTLAALAGLWWVFGKGVDLLLTYIPARNNLPSRILAATAMAKARRTYLLRVGQDVAVGVFIGRTDQLGDAVTVYRAISDVLDPPPEYAPPSERWRPKTMKDGDPDA